MNTDTRRIRIHYLTDMTNLSRQQYNQSLSHAANDLKYWMSAPTTVAWYMIGIALDLVRGASFYKYSAKRLFLTAEKERDRWMYSLAHPDPMTQLRLFHLDDQDPQWRSRYRADLTDEDYIEFWQGQGAHVYGKIRPIINSLTWKYRRHLDEHHVADAEAIATAMTTDMMLASAAAAYDNLTFALQKTLPPTKPDLRQMFSTLSMQRVLDAWHKAVMTLVKGVPEFTQMELDNISLSTKQINDRLDDPVLICEVTRDNIRDYDRDIFSSKAVVKELVRDATAKIRENKIAERERKLEEFKHQFSL